MLTNLRMFAVVSAGLASPALPALPANAAEQAAQGRTIEIVVDGPSYAPSQIAVQQGERVRLKFVRKDWNACTRELVIPALKLRKELPTNKAVIVDLPTSEAGNLEFRCGMNMVRGSVTVVAR